MYVPAQKTDKSFVTNLLNMKREHGVKSVKELNDLGLIKYHELDNYTKKSLFEFEYDDDGYCIYKKEYDNPNLQTYGMSDITRLKVYSIRHVCDVLSVPHYVVEYPVNIININNTSKENLLDHIFSRSKTIKKRMFTNEANLRMIIMALDTGVYGPSVDHVFHDFSDALTSSQTIKFTEYLNKILSEIGIKHYCVYRRLLNYSNNAKYEGCKDDMRHLDCIADVEFEPQQYKYIVHNKNEEVVKFYVENIDRELLQSLISKVEYVTDAAYRYVWDILDDYYGYSGLNNITNQVHRLQVKHNLNCMMYRGILRDSKMDIINFCGLDFNLREYLFDSAIDDFIFISASSIREMRIDRFTDSKITNLQNENFNMYKIYKYLKHSSRSIISAAVLSKYIEYFDSHIIAMILENHYCVIDNRVMRNICEDNELVEIFTPYVNPELVKLHVCNSDNCQYKKFMTNKTKSAKRIY